MRYLKIGCTWSDVKSLRQDMERSLSSSNAHFRIKLLQAAAQLQVSTPPQLCISSFPIEFKLVSFPCIDCTGSARFGPVALPAVEGQSGNHGDIYDLPLDKHQGRPVLTQLQVASSLQIAAARGHARREYGQRSFALFSSGM